MADGTTNAPYTEPGYRTGVYELSAFPTGYITAKSVGATAAQLDSTSSALAQGVLIKADKSNSSTLYVGYADTVTADAGASTSGFPLSAGEGVILPINDPSSVWIIGGAASQNYVAIGVVG